MGWRRWQEPCLGARQRATWPLVHSAAAPAMGAYETLGPGLIRLMAVHTLGVDSESRRRLRSFRCSFTGQEHSSYSRCAQQGWKHSAPIVLAARLSGFVCNLLNALINRSPPKKSGGGVIQWVHTCGEAVKRFWRVH